VAYSHRALRTSVSRIGAPNPAAPVAVCVPSQGEPTQDQSRVAPRWCVPGVQDEGVRFALVRQVHVVLKEPTNKPDDCLRRVADKGFAPMSPNLGVETAATFGATFRSRHKNASQMSRRRTVGQWRL
jgi:hypothetical protein